jgi:hypothetical protein
MGLRSQKSKSFGRLLNPLFFIFFLTFTVLQASSCSDHRSSIAWMSAMANGEVLSDRDVKTLRKEFKKKLKKEMSDLSSLQKKNRAQSKRDRKQSFKNWNQEEKRARHAYFEVNPKGANRREYIRGFIERRDVILAKNKEEEKEMKAQQDKELAHLKKNHEERLKSLEDYLSRKQRPPQELWGTQSP